MNFPTIECSNPAYSPPGIHFITVKSPALNHRADISVFVPPNLSDAPLPLVTLLHGVYGSHWAWLFKAGAHEVLMRLIKDEGLPPMALAMPSDGLWGDGSGYLRHFDADYPTWIIDEVPAAVAKLDPRTEHAPRFLCGLSMGGYGTLRLGALYRRRKMYRDAALAIRQALRLAPKSAPYHCLLADLYSDLRLDDYAVHHYQAAGMLDDYDTTQLHRLRVYAGIESEDLLALEAFELDSNGDFAMPSDRE